MCNMIMPTQDIKNFWHRHETSFQEILVINEKAILFIMKINDKCTFSAGLLHSFGTI